MRNKRTSETLRFLLHHARYEVLPTATIEQKILEAVPRDVTLTVTAAQPKGLEATLGCAERLRAAGYRVVPHLAARMISGRVELAEIVARLRAADIDSVFVPAGDADPPAGAYQGSLDLLRDLAEVGSPFGHVGVAGYPETHPRIVDDVTVQAMWDKRNYATHIVSNMCFDASVVQDWVGRVRKRGTNLPVLVGLPGPVERTKLLSMATKIGVSDSARFLAKNKSMFAKIAAPGGFSPERFLERLCPVAADPRMHVAGLHLFTFNQVAETHAWRQRMLARLGEERLPA